MAFRVIQAARVFDYVVFTFRVRATYLAGVIWFIR